MWSVCCCCCNKRRLVKGRKKFKQQRQRRPAGYVPMWGETTTTTKRKEVQCCVSFGRSVALSRPKKNEVNEERNRAKVELRVVPVVVRTGGMCWSTDRHIFLTTLGHLPCLRVASSSLVLPTTPQRHMHGHWWWWVESVRSFVRSFLVLSSPPSFQSQTKKWNRIFSFCSIVELYYS